MKPLIAHDGVEIALLVPLNKTGKLTVVLTLGAAHSIRNASFGILPAVLIVSYGKLVLRKAFIPLLRIPETGGLDSIQLKGKKPQLGVRKDVGIDGLLSGNAELLYAGLWELGEDEISHLLFQGGREEDSIAKLIFREGLSATLRQMVGFIKDANIPIAYVLGEADIGGESNIGEQGCTVPFLELLLPIFNKDIAGNDYEDVAVGEKKLLYLGYGQTGFANSCASLNDEVAAGGGKNALGDDVTEIFHGSLKLLSL